MEKKKIEVGEIAKKFELTVDELKEMVKSSDGSVTTTAVLQWVDKTLAQGFYKSCGFVKPMRKDFKTKQEYFAAVSSWEVVMKVITNMIAPFWFYQGRHYEELKMEFMAQLEDKNEAGSPHNKK